MVPAIHNAEMASPLLTSTAATYGKFLAVKMIRTTSVARRIAIALTAAILDQMGGRSNRVTDGVDLVCSTCVADTVD